MPVSRQVRNLGARWPVVCDRAAAFAQSMPAEGVSRSTFERAVLLDVPFKDVLGVLAALHGRGIIWRSQSRGAVRVFPRRPLSRPSAQGRHVEVFLSASIPHFYRLASALRCREDAKRAKHIVEAQDARELVAVSASAIVSIAARHVERGVSLASLRDAVWSVFPAEVLDALSTFEEGFARRSTATTLSIGSKTITARRIAADLAPAEKVAALIAKAGIEGSTKTALYQAIRPKLPAKDLSQILDRLIVEGEAEARDVRVVGSRRQGVRFFATSLPDAAEG